jgi:hypothetical protein
VTLKVVASRMIVILTTLEVSSTLVENINGSGITQDDCHFTIIIFYSTGDTFDHTGGTKICQPQRWLY